ncbi:hypothetical protein ACVWWK_006135 [Bradyrhizobium sp. LB9.1b]
MIEPWLTGGAGRGSVPSSPKGAQADVARAVPHHKENSQSGNAERDADKAECKPPAVSFGQACKQRQEDELAGGDARGQNADDEAAPRREPAGRNGGAQHQRGHAGAETDHDAPQYDELPDLCHAERQDQPGDDDELSQQRDVAQAVAVQERGSERRHQPEQDEADRQRGRDLRRAPAELFLKRNDEHDRAHRPCRR